jgi:murein DD-endopeptidase MepM/ murein hydrolase activator NlpD
VDIDYSNLDFMQQLFNYFCHPLGLNGNTAKVTSYVSHGGAVDVSYSNGNDAVGSPVYSMTDGIITAAKYGCESIAKTSEEKGQNGGLGNHVIVKCTNTKYNELIDDNFYIVYAHLINPEDTTYSLSKTWKEGDSISKGSIIGGIGASGNTEGVDGYFVHVHIHFRTNSSDPSSTIKLVQNGNYSIPNWDSLKNKTIASSSSSSSGLPVIENNSLNYCYGIFSGTPELFTCNLESSLSVGGG